MPVEFLAQNMSNRLDWVHAPEEAQVKPAQKHSLRSRIIELPIARRILLGIHDRIFRLYYDS
jgi:hypothetical protein